MDLKSELNIILTPDVKTAMTVLLPVIVMAVIACLSILIMRLSAPRKDMIERRMTARSGQKASYINTAEEDGILKKLERNLAQADVGISVPVYFAVLLVSAFVIYLLTVYLTGAKTAGLLAACSGVFIPPYIIGFLKTKKAAEFDTMFMKALKRMSGNLRAEASLEQAIMDVAAAETLPEAVREQFRTTLADYRGTGDMKKAFMAMYERTGDKDVKSVALAIAISERNGSSLAEIFDSYAQTISKRKIMEANARSELSSTRLDTLIVCAAPILFGAVMKIMQPDYFDIVYTWLGGLGRYILIGVYAVVVVGFFLLMKLCNVKLSE